MKKLLCVLMTLLTVNSWAGLLVNKDNNESISFKRLNNRAEKILEVDGTNAGEGIVTHKILSLSEALEIESRDNYIAMGVEDGTIDLSNAPNQSEVRASDLRQVFPAINSDAVIEVSSKRFNRIKSTLKAAAIL